MGTPGGLPVHPTAKLGIEADLAGRAERDHAIDRPLNDAAGPGWKAAYHAHYPNGIDFISTPHEVVNGMKVDLRIRNILLQTGAVDYTPIPGHRLVVFLTARLGVPVTQQQVNYMAWLIGMWLSDGTENRVRITQGGPPPFELDPNDQQVIDANGQPMPHPRAPLTPAGVRPHQTAILSSWAAHTPSLV